MTATAQLSLHKITHPRTSELQDGSSYFNSKKPQQRFKADDVHAMLKSHFNLKKDEAEEIEPEEETHKDEEPPVEEEKIVEEADERVLQKSEVSLRLSWLGKTAEGDG